MGSSTSHNMFTHNDIGTVAALASIHAGLPQFASLPHIKYVANTANNWFCTGKQFAVLWQTSANCLPKQRQTTIAKLIPRHTSFTIRQPQNLGVIITLVNNQFAGNIRHVINPSPDF